MEYRLLALAVLLSISCRTTQPSPRSDEPSAWVDVVALESAASKAEGPDASIGFHTRAIAAARPLGRARLTAVLFLRLGLRLLADQRIQDAVLAYEAGFKSLAADPTLHLEPVLEQLARIGKGLPKPTAPVPLELYSEAVDRALNVEEADETLTIKLLIGIGNAYFSQSQSAPALNAYQQALARPELDRAPTMKAHVLANSGELLRRDGQVAAAHQQLTQAIDLLEQLGEGLDARTALGLLAGIERDRGDLPKARALYQRSLERSQLAHDGRGEAIAHTGLAGVLADQARCAEAVVEFRLALAIDVTRADERLLWPAWWGLGRCEEALGHLDQAREALTHSADTVRHLTGQLRTDEGKVGTIETAQQVFDELMKVELARAQADPRAFADALALAEELRGRSLRELMEGWGVHARPSPQSLGLVSCDVAQTMVEPVRDFNLGTQTAPSTSVGPNASAFVKTTAVHRPPRGPLPAPLPRLVYFVMNEATLVLVVDADGTLHGHVAAIGASALEQRVTGLRRALHVDQQGRGVRGLQLLAGGPTPLPPDAALRELYDLLVGPLARHLPPRDATLAIEPHGVLWLLPFAALRAPDGVVVGERWPLVYAPSAALLDEARAAAHPKPRTELKGLFIGNPIVNAIKTGREEVAGLGFDPLPGAQVEVARISEFFAAPGRTLLTGQAGDLATFARGAGQYDILHLATHGVSRSDAPLESFVVLAPSRCGDLLTARRVLTLDLDAELVTLSACQTGVGKVAAEGVLGLSRSFLFAGARSVLVSHWSVSDEATTSLMTAFYRHYVVDGLSKAQSLRLSMAELRARPGFDAPRYWAPFFLVGAE
jgi:tetratricopeptide (TPR) repeat protein